MICAVCSAHAPHCCGSCSSVWYCSAEHQKDHWKIHRKNCPYFEIVEEPNVGKGFVATRDIKPGTIILEELPVAVAPFGLTACLTCGFIAGTLRTVRRCSRCKWPVCSWECEKLPLHSENECQVFALQDYPRFPEHFQKEVVFCDIVMVIRVGMLKRKDPGTYEQVMKLCSEYQLPNDETDCETAKVVDWLKISLAGFGGLEMSPVEISKLLKIFHINCFTGWRKEVLSGLYPNASARPTSSSLYLKSSRMNHSCIPNCERDLCPKQGFKIRFRTTSAVKKGEALTHFYYVKHIHEETNRRQHLIRKRGHFRCECVRCKDPTELGTYRSGVVCEKCRGFKTSTLGYFLPDDPLNLNADAKWKCNCCGDIKLAKDVLQMVEELLLKISKMETKFGRKPGDDTLIVFCKEFVIETSGINLHPNHWIIQCVNKIACTYLTNWRTKTMSLDWNDYMVKYCKHTLSVLDLVSPGLTRGRVVSKLQLAMILHLQHVHLLSLEMWEEVERNLEESVRLLKEVLKYYTNEFPTEDVDLTAVQIKNLLFKFSKELIDFRLKHLKASGFVTSQ